MIAVVLIVTGVVIGALRIGHTIDAVDTDHRFVDGDVVTVRLEPGSEKSIWQRDEPFGPYATPTCGITGPGEPGLTEPVIDVFLTRNEEWNPLHGIDVTEAGEYRITCSSEVPTKYAIGDSVGYFSLAGWLVLAVALPVFGVTLCVVIVLVTAFRRRRHRKRLLAERHGSGGGNPAHAGPSSAGAGVR
ncbi:hypothetical protein [Streptomyces sp. NPDC048606]|uniref:hypothetical protein n=1 Tax=Streptomyces sp. NPDC048606 TaxID=3154726 RepID=UPI00341566F2